MLSSIDFNTDELDNDYPVYYNLFSGCESDTPPTPEQCGVGLSDEEYYKKLEKVRLMEMEDNNRMRRWELQTYGRTDREYAYGKDWKYIPPSQAIVVDRNNIALYWKPTNTNAGNKTPFIVDAITDVKSPNAHGAVIFDSRSTPSSSMVISDGDHFTKMTAQEKRIISTVERLSKNNDAISLQSFINMEEASFNQRIINQDTSLDSSLNKYINQGGNRMQTTPVTEMKFNPEDIKRINDMGNNNSFFNGLSTEEVAAKWNYMSQNNIPINAAKEVIFGDVKTPTATATPTSANPALNAAIAASFNGGSMGTNNNVYIPTAADMEAAKKKYNELTGGNTVSSVNSQPAAQPAVASKPQDDPVAQMVQRGVESFKQATTQVQQPNNDLLNALMTKMSAMMQNAPQVSAPAPEIHHTVFTAGGVDTKGTLREQLLTISDVLMYGLNSNNQDVATSINIIMDLAGLEQKDLYTKQNQGIDYNIYCRVIDQLCDRISKVTDGTGFFINQQIIKYVQNTIINGPNSLIEPLYFYEMLATLAFEGYISLADTMYPDLRNSLLQAILYFQKNPMPNIPKDPNHPDGKLNMVPILFGPGGLFETQMIYLNNNNATTYATTTPVATQTVYSVNQNNLGGNSMNSVFDRYDSRQMATTVTGVNPYGTLYSTTASPVGNYNYVGTGSTVTNTGVYGTAMAPNNIYLNNGTGSAFQAGIQTALGGYGAGRDSVMATPVNNNFIRTGVAQPVVNTYQQPVISARYAPTANTTVYGTPATPAQPNNQVDMMGMFATMLGMLSSIENVGGRNVIDVRNLASMFGGGTGGAGVVERFGRSSQQMNTFGTYGTTFGTGAWGTTNYGNTWNTARPAGWGTGGTLPTYTSTTGTWGSTPTYNSGLGLSFATPTTTGVNFNTASTFNYNPAASVGSGVSNLTFGGNTGNWGATTTPTWGGNTGTWGGNTAGFVNNTVQNTGHTVFGRQGEDKIAAALGLTR